jgi:hypothetical protein
LGLAHSRTSKAQNDEQNNENWYQGEAVPEYQEPVVRKKSTKKKGTGQFKTSLPTIQTATQPAPSFWEKALEALKILGAMAALLALLYSRYQLSLKNKESSLKSDEIADLNDRLRELKMESQNLRKTVAAFPDTKVQIKVCEEKIQQMAVEITHLRAIPPIEKMRGQTDKATLKLLGLD